MIARRYLASRKQVSLISVITGISIAGVSLSVAALIVVLSVMNGFYDIVRDLLVSLDPHVRVESADGGGFASEEALELSRDALSLEHVEEASAYIEGKALLTHQGSGVANRVVIVRGVDPATFEGVSRVMGQTGQGSFSLQGRGIVIGAGLGQRVGLLPPTGTEPGGQVALFSAPGIGRMLTRVFSPPPLERFEVRGLFQLEETYDNTHVFVGIDEARRLFQMQGAVSGVELRLDHLDRAHGVKHALQAQLDPERFIVESWYDLQASLYDVMRLEKWGASVVLILISIVAAFNIIGSLTMVVIEKRRDVGVLRALGVSRRNIRRIFLMEGALIGILGSGIGFALGLSLVLMQDIFQLAPLLGADSFVIDAYPVSIRALDLLVIGVVSFGLCLAASLYPAARAAKIEPARAVQMDR